ncbi:MAG: ABC transporter ATP-binding protein/permease, partial [Candidatus Dadabacteria bacterium]|nr:ABC transporter ATP-binding protein/permease [Candidatus Dadabacteria bacterium]
LYIVGLAVIMSIFRFFWRYFILGASRKVEFRLRNEFFSHLQGLSFDFYGGRKVGDLMALTVNDIEAIRMACGIGVVVAYDGILLLVFILAAMAYVSPTLTLYALIPFPILAIIVARFGKTIEDRFEKVQASFSELTEKARESISGVKVVKAFVKEKSEVEDFESASNEYLSVNLHLIKIWGVYQPLITFIAGIATAIFLWIGGRSTITLGITLGDFAAISIYLGMLTWPMIAMGWAVDIIKRGNASINRVNEILLTRPEVADTQDSVEIEIKGRIEFRNLSFTYPSGKNALTSVNLTVPQGTSFGITGGTGSGKSTLLKLLMRVLEPSEDQIYLDGIDVRNVKKDSLRKALIFLPQETVIFSGTIRDNIAFMNPNLSDQEVIEASRLVEIYNEIEMFPGGLDARVGERGLSLSGGQRQRIALARAILLKPRVLILDDVLSSLDLRTEGLVLKNLRRFMNGKTLIVVSSKVPSISGFDKIAVLDKGRLAELGNHNDLLYSDGIYTKLYRVHTLGEESKLSLEY